MRAAAVVALVLAGGALAAVPAAATSPTCGAQIAHATWHVVAQGRRLIVTPSACGRRTAARQPRAAFAEAIRRGGHGAPDRRSLYWQFVCHAEFATYKPTWDLEAWRPDVGLTATIFAACNPR